MQNKAKWMRIESAMHDTPEVTEREERERERERAEKASERKKSAKKHGFLNESDIYECEPKSTLM
jgi:hypothetical protein